MKLPWNGRQSAPRLLFAASHAGGGVEVRALVLPLAEGHPAGFQLMFAAATSTASTRHPFKRHIERGECAPLHPGEVLREDFLPYHRLTVAELARRIQIEPASIHSLLNEQTSVSPELADRLSAVFALPARYWLALQMQYDLWHALAAPDNA